MVRTALQALCEYGRTLVIIAIIYLIISLIVKNRINRMMTFNCYRLGIIYLIGGMLMVIIGYGGHKHMESQSRHTLALCSN